MFSPNWTRLLLNKITKCLTANLWLWTKHKISSATFSHYTVYTGTERRNSVETAAMDRHSLHFHLTQYQSMAALSVVRRSWACLNSNRVACTFNLSVVYTYTAIHMHSGACPTAPDSRLLVLNDPKWTNFQKCVLCSTKVAIKCVLKLTKDVRGQNFLLLFITGTQMHFIDWGSKMH